ncbi:MAG: DUF2085 domain-containing protein [Chloroflexota bacterium]|nr:DUF2085 domain-containing protein [Chloroflexota bacterium]
MSARPSNRPITPGRIRANRWILGFTRHWVRVLLVIIGLYSTLPLVAPTLMRVGARDLAQVLYTFYSPFCHQFAFRSLFLFGEQAAYPRSISESGLRSFEDAVQGSPEWQSAVEQALIWRYGSVDAGQLQAFDPYQFDITLQIAARYFPGNEQMGYKTALCARDVAIYLAMFIGGLVYSLPAIRRRLRPAPIWLYVLLGLGPIGIDGVSQLLGYILVGNPPMSLWAARETTPFFRILTGVVFGLMNIWIGFPYLELSMRESRDRILEKFAKLGISA